MIFLHMETGMGSVCRVCVGSLVKKDNSWTLEQKEEQAPACPTQGVAHHLMQPGCEWSPLFYPDPEPGRAEPNR